jgi:VanZ family protein
MITGSLHGGSAGRGAGPATKAILRIWLPTAIYVILIMVLALRPSPRLPSLRNIDKYAHAAAYAVLGFFAYHAVIRSSFNRPVILTLLLALVVGLADECLQALSGVRTADRYDLMADLIGVAVGVVFVSRFLKPEKNVARRTGPRN